MSGGVEPVATRLITNKPWTAEQIRALGARTDVKTACAVLGMSERKGRELMRTDKFPVPIVKVSNRVHLVPVAPILTLLGLEDA
jgi:hypothetical protein